jgi:hypothetical protein
MSDHLTPEQAPERIWARFTEDFGAVQIGQWADSIRIEPHGTEYIRADVCAAEIARLTAKVEAGERLAEACRGLHPIDTWGTPLGAALKAYEEAGK